jgi:hypothetical protein
MYERILFRLSQELPAILLAALAFICGWALLAGRL